MKTTTNIKLFIKGMSVDDIKELETLGIEDEDALAAADKGISLDDLKKVIELEKNNDVPDTPDESPKQPDDVDYKSLYEAEKEKVSQLQTMNQKKSVGEDQPTPTDFDHLCELFKNA